VWRALRLVGYVQAWWQVILRGIRRRTRIIHVQWCMVPTLDIAVFALLRLLGVRLVYTVHNALPHGDRRRTSKWRYRQLYRLAHALIVLSEQVGRDVENWVLPGAGKKTSVIEHGLLYPKTPSPTREVARRSLELGDDEELVLFFGGISAYKGITDLIDAFALAAQQRPKLRLLIAGNPLEPFAPYAARVRESGLGERVRAYPEFVPESFKVMLYAAADIAVLPHRDPSQSAMGLESLALGKPLIATNAGGLPELIDHGRTGYLVPVQDPPAIAAALRAFFELSREEQRAMAEAGRQLGLQRFNWEVIAAKHVALYRRLAAR
jgi:glycosyltransferase involved in cell wall biosynthesis